MQSGQDEQFLPIADQLKFSRNPLTLRQFEFIISPASIANQVACVHFYRRQPEIVLRLGKRIGGRFVPLFLPRLSVLRPPDFWASPRQNPRAILPLPRTIVADGRPGDWISARRRDASSSSQSGGGTSAVQILLLADDGTSPACGQGFAELRRVTLIAAVERKAEVGRVASNRKIDDDGDARLDRGNPADSESVRRCELMPRPPAI